MFAVKGSINFLIAHQLQQRKRRQSWHPSRLLGPLKKVVVATNVEAEIPENKEEVDDAILTYEELKEMCGYSGVSVETDDD